MKEIAHKARISDRSTRGSLFWGPGRPPVCHSADAGCVESARPEMKNQSLNREIASAKSGCSSPTRRSCSTRSHATTSSCLANCSRLFSTTCVRRRPENDSPKSQTRSTGSPVVRKSVPADSASRRLAVSILWQDDESCGAPQKIPQPCSGRHRDARSSDRLLWLSDT